MVATGRSNHCGNCGYENGICPFIRRSRERSRVVWENRGDDAIAGFPSSDAISTEVASCGPGMLNV